MKITLPTSYIHFVFYKPFDLVIKRFVVHTMCSFKKHTNKNLFHGLYCISLTTELSIKFRIYNTVFKHV